MKSLTEPEVEVNELWRKAWGVGVAPFLSDESLDALRRALIDDDPALIQGGTTEPAPIACVWDWKCEKGCLIAYCGMADGLETVGEVEEFFFRMCIQINERLGEDCASCYLTNWWDETPRSEARRLMLSEVNRTIKLRAIEAA